MCGPEIFIDYFILRNVEGNLLNQYAIVSSFSFVRIHKLQIQVDPISSMFIIEVDFEVNPCIGIDVSMAVCNVLLEVENDG